MSVRRRLLLADLLLIDECLAMEKVNNGVNLLIDRFNDKVVHSLQAMHQYSQRFRSDLDHFQLNTKYVCNELTDRILLDDRLSENEKTVLGCEIRRFMQDARAHIQEVDNFSYELRTLVQGTFLKKLRGLTKTEYKQKIRDIIRFIEKAAVPMHVFKTVGFALRDNVQLQPKSVDDGKLTGLLEKDYPDDKDE